MSKKSLFVLAVAVVLVIIGVIYWQANKNGISIAELVSLKTKEKINWDDPNQIFNIKAPDDFDATHLERLEEKVTVAKDLYEKQKDDTWTWIVIGSMYEFAHDYDRAIGAYEKSAVMNEFEYISRMNLAYIYENQKKDFAAAEKYYKEVLKLTPGNPANYVSLAKLYEFKMERVGDAEKTYLDGLADTGDNPDLLVALIRFYKRQNMVDKAAERAKALIELFPDNDAYKSDFVDLIK